LGRPEQVHTFAFAAFQGNTLVAYAVGLVLTDDFARDHQVLPNVFEYFYDPAIM